MANHRKYSIVAFTCEACGVSFERKNNRVYRFCSPKCRAKALNVKDPSKWTVYTCKNCGKQFEDWVYRNTGYCSRQCNALVASKCPRPKYSPQDRGGKVTWNCKQCGKEMRTFKSRVQDCCSTKCAYLYWPVDYELSGKHTGNWRGGQQSMDRGPHWTQDAKKIRKRDNHTCQVCGETGFSVHHIIPFRAFNGDWQNANLPSNLITLCRKCHIRVERNKIPCPKPQNV